MAVSGTTNCVAKVGTGYGYEKDEAYTSAGLDKTATPFFWVNVNFINKE